MEIIVTWEGGCGTSSLFKTWHSTRTFSRIHLSHRKAKEHKNNSRLTESCGYHFARSFNMELWPIANGWQICCVIEARGWKQWKKLQNDLIELMKRSLDKRFQTIERETVYAKNILTLQPSEEVIWIHWRKVKGNKWHVSLLWKTVCFKVEKIFLQEN